MRSTRVVQVIIILLICGLVAFIYFNGKNNPSALLKNDTSHVSSGEVTQHKAGEPFSFDLYAKEIKKQFSKADAEEVGNLEQQLKSEPSKELMMRLAEKYDKLKAPALAGHYYLRVAESRNNDAKSWAMAGKEFFEAQGMFAGSPPFDYFVDESMKAYDKALELNPRDLESKANQAVNFIEGKREPMKGIGMLREIVQVDSNNRSAIMYLGVLSMQSGQYDKAVKRFEKLVDIDPNHSDYYRYLGEAYISSGQKDKGRKELEKYKSMIHDVHLKAEVDEMMK